jgi:hypothetical protein
LRGEFVMNDAADNIGVRSLLNLCHLEFPDAEHPVFR